MSQNWKDEPVPEEDVQMPLGTGDAAPAEEAYSPPKARVNSSTITLFIAFAAALGVLWLLGIQNKPRAADAANAAKVQRISDEMDKLISAKDGGRIDDVLQNIPRLVKILREYLGSKPPELVNLEGNPFQREDVRPVPSGNSKTTSVIPANAADAEVLRRIAEFFPTLKVNSIILGKTPVAMIGPRMSTIGTKFGDKKGALLVVTDIQSGRVVLTDLTNSKNSFELKLNNSSVNQDETGH